MLLHQISIKVPNSNGSKGFSLILDICRSGKTKVKQTQVKLKPCISSSSTRKVVHDPYTYLRNNPDIKIFPK